VIKQLLRSKITGFILTKYLAFGIQLVNTVLIAKYLGPYYFGLFGFAIMLLQYSSYLNLGVQYSYSFLYADVASIKNGSRTKITETSISIILAVCLSLILFYLLTFTYDFFPKYRFHQYYWVVVLIAVAQLLNNLFVNIFRIYGKTSEINLFFLFVPLFQLLVTLLFRESSLFFALLYATLGANILSCIIFCVNFPKEIRNIRIPRFGMSSLLLKRGIFLLFYNLTFYGILLTARTIVSEIFPVDQFGLFNFANSVSNAVFLLLGSLNFLFYPKLINLISTKNDKEELILFVEKIRRFYLTLTLLIVFFSLISLPVLFFFLPKYTDALAVLQILLLAQLIINNSFGYSTLLLQKGKEILMTLMAVIAIAIIVVVSLIGIWYFQQPMEFVAVSVVLGVLAYNFMVVYAGNKITDQFPTFWHMVRELYKFDFFAPVLLYVVLAVANREFNYINAPIALGVYVFLNFKSLKQIIRKSVEMLFGKNNLLDIS
jgi:O-antigen/teichoic acid export membrane protein